MPFGNNLARMVRKHHEKNGGMSRYEKLPLYLTWAGINYDQKIVKKYSYKFSLLVVQKVIESTWVPGVIDFLNKKKNGRSLFLITATPQSEIEKILTKLKIANIFKSVIGSPIKKTDAINSIMNKFLILPEDALMFGDSYSDYIAAKNNQIKFVLRKTKINISLQNTLKCSMIDDFNSINFPI